MIDQLKSPPYVINDMCLVLISCYSRTRISPVMQSIRKGIRADPKVRPRSICVQFVTIYEVGIFPLFSFSSFLVVSYFMLSIFFYLDIVNILIYTMFLIFPPQNPEQYKHIVSGPYSIKNHRPAFFPSNLKYYALECGLQRSPLSYGLTLHGSPQAQLQVHFFVLAFQGRTLDIFKAELLEKPILSISKTLGSISYQEERLAIIQGWLSSFPSGNKMTFSDSYVQVVQRLSPRKLSKCPYF